MKLQQNKETRKKECCFGKVWISSKDTSILPAVHTLSTDLASFFPFCHRTVKKICISINQCVNNPSLPFILNNSFFYLSHSSFGTLTNTIFGIIVCLFPHCHVHFSRWNRVTIALGYSSTFRSGKMPRTYQLPGSRTGTTSHSDPGDQCEN